MAKEGKCVIVVLHDIIQALETADKIIVMKEGRVVSEDTPDNIFYSRVLDDVFSITLEKENGRYFYLRKKDGS